MGEECETCPVEATEVCADCNVNLCFDCSIEDERRGLILCEACWIDRPAKQIAKDTKAMKGDSCEVDKN